MKISFTNNKKNSFEKTLKLEKLVYKEQIISKSTKKSKVIFKNILRREITIIEDRAYNLPQNIFMLEYYDGLTLVGRKIRSSLHIQNKINAINCSKITSSMILGILEGYKKYKDIILVYYYPFTKGERLTVFNSMSKNRLIDISYPFRFRDYYTKKEKSSSSKGWSINKDKAIYLGLGEKHYRDYIINYINENKIIMDNTIVFDPACSTGEFLHELKCKFQTCNTVGQDLSKEMIDYAKDFGFIDIAYCGNSMTPYVSENSVDILILRFLNSEVVTTVMAHRLLNVLVKTVKKDGLIFCFGHTPVLIRLKYFLSQNLEVLHTNGYDKISHSIFQLYIFKKLF